MEKRTGVMDTPDVTKDEPVVEEEVEESLIPDDPGDPKEELFPGGPTWGQVAEWKKEFGDIYVTSFTPENHMVWRTLTRFEYKRLVKNMEMAITAGQVTQSEANFNNEELMCEICVLHPKMTKAEMSTDMAGIASIISQEIMEASGFVALDVRSL